jgi:hypothetical protein
MTAMTGPACREIRQLLGVYVVGAIDPAERSMVDHHLSGCQACREELSGLAGLPALLGRVPREDVERMGEGAPAIPEMAEPPAELLNGLLRRVSSTRRSRRWRSVLALAAAVAIAAGGAGAAVNALTAKAFHDTDNGSNGVVAAVVNYSATPWGTAMQVGVTGVPPGSMCTLWANRSGHWVSVGTWQALGPDYTRHWYYLSPHIDARAVHGFQITTGPANKVILKIPDS